MYEADFSNPLEKNMGYGSSVFTFYSNSFLKTQKNRSKRKTVFYCRWSLIVYSAIVSALSKYNLNRCQKVHQ